MSVARQLLRFAVVGVLLTIVHVVVCILLIEIAGAGSVSANAVAFVVATLLGYVVNTRWSFASPLSRRAFQRYAVVAGSGFVLTVAISALIARLGLPYGAAITLIVTVVPLLSFGLHRFWTYRNADEQGARWG